MDKIFYVYAHTDKTGKMVYIGQGKGIRAWSRDRSMAWKDHFKDTQPEVSMFAMNLTQQEAWDMERKLITQYKFDGVQLLNRAKGGRGGYDKEAHPLWKTKRSQATIGKMLATKTKNNSFAKYWLGKKRDPELIKKMCIASMTPEAKEKRYSKTRGRVQSEEEKAQRRKSAKKRAILCIETGKEYESANEAGRQLSMGAGKITEICQGKRKTHKGYSWKYA